LPSLLDRVRQALAPQYVVESEIATGGMGVVFRAHDTRLDRAVAVKVLRPDRAGAVGAERFLREARLHARVRHPNVVPIHIANEADGLFYYVMDFVEGETLAQRLARGPLQPRAVRALGRHLLDALSAAHAQDVIHRDIKPGNVFVGDRILLADFGIARAQDDSTITADGEVVGTPAYMPPEQRNGDATAATDLYAIAAVLYEASTGRRWDARAHPEQANWSRIPGRLARALRHGLAPDPKNRWANAEAFREALRDPTHWGTVALYAGLLVAGVAAGYLARWWLRPPLPPPPAVDFAMVPITAETAGSTVGREVARYAGSLLEWYPAWSIRPTAATFVWWDSTPAALRPIQAFHALRARLYVEGEIVSGRDGTAIHLTIRDSTGALLHLVDVPGSVTNPIGWGSGVADSIVRRTYPEHLDGYRRAVRRSSTSVSAYSELFKGQKAFSQDNWDGAEAHYRRALQFDPGFSHAAWALALIQRWRRDSATTDVLRQLYATGRDDLPGLQRLLTEAQLEPDLTRRLELFAQAVQQYPTNGDGLLLFGNELFSRGPLVGIPVDSGVRVFEATTKREFFTTAYVHAALGHIRLGQRDQAARDLRNLPRPSDSADPEARLRGRLLGFAYDERFRPWRAWLSELWLGWRPDSTLLRGIRQYARFGNFFDIPRAQLMLGRTLVASGRDVATRATGHQAQGLALMLFGRSGAALAQLDSAAELFHTAEAELQRAQWRVFLLPLGLGQPSPAELQTARRRLAALADGPSGARAAWSLAAEAIHQGASPEAERWTARVARDTADEGARALHRLLLAMGAGRRGLPDTAIALVTPLLRYDPRGVGADPFARALLHLQLGDWLARTRDAGGAERAWVWAEAWDAIGWPQQEVQAGEVDVALSAVARLRRGRLALERGDSAVGCKHLKRVGEIWTGAEPAMAGVRALTDSLARGCR